MSTASQMEGFVFGTKAGTLSRLTGAFTDAKLCPQEIIQRSSWQNDRKGIAQKIGHTFSGDRLAIRSSAQGEDGENESMAGAFTSLLNIESIPHSIAKAVDQVFASYKQNNDGDEVLVQPMVRDVVISGVVLTRDLDTGSPYYVINYDDASGRTDTVTGGQESKTIIVHRTRPDKLKSPRMRRLIDCVIEVENVTQSHELDIEFCITKDDEVFILQVRPLAARSNWSTVSDAKIDSAIDEIRARIELLSAPLDGVFGEGTVLSEMTDWNPAEMIGNAPRPLALSLYKLLITDHVWAEARALMGYKMVEGPLLTDLHGRPYIDVRKSFNSFLPSDIKPDHAHRLVTHQLRVLAENRELHDKIEFEIAITCCDFSKETIHQRLRDAGFNNSERADIKTSIHALTARLVEPGGARLRLLIDQANQLLKPHVAPEKATPLERIKSLLRDVKTHGTLPFSQLARHGFIGVQLLRSLEAREVFSAKDTEQFMRGVHTIATDIIHDMYALGANEISQSDFLSRYGHLRPGTYDILSWRYDERPDIYLGQSSQTAPKQISAYVPTSKQQNAIDSLIKEIGFNISSEDLLDYITIAIQGREQSKFAFTRAISDSLRLLSEWGDSVDLSRDDLSFLPISAFTKTVSEDDLRKQVIDARRAYAVTRGVRLPHVIFDVADVDVVRIPLGQPTFITAKSVAAPGKLLTSNDTKEIDGHIVLIESADPGFDWIFSRPIVGLVTKYGGANSHMAIRSAEFGLPAAIGCGERLFETLTRASTIELNAAAGRVVGH